jgi:hypothetical protein
MNIKLHDSKQFIRQVLLATLAIISVCFYTPAFSADDQDIVSDSTSISKEEVTRQFNDEVRKTSRRLRTLEGGIPLSTGTTGILEVSRGGTGLNNSAVAANSIPYFSSTGVMSNLAIGTTGYVLTAGSPPAWTISVPPFTAGDYFAGGTFLVGVNPTSTTPTKVLEVFIPRGGSLRIKFHLDGQGGGGTAFGQIYRNGSAVGTLRSNLNGTGTNYSEDISGWTAGDLCQLYVYSSSGANDAYGASLLLYEGTPTTTTVNRATYYESNRYTGSIVPTTLLNDLGQVGDEYLNTGGGAATTLYVKTAATTWTAK